MIDEADAGIAEHQPGHDQRRVDPRYLSDDERKPAAVWAESLALREVLDLVLRKEQPDVAGRGLLLSALKKQLPTLLLYGDVVKNRDVPPPPPDRCGCRGDPLPYRFSRRRTGPNRDQRA